MNGKFQTVYLYAIISILSLFCQILSAHAQDISENTGTSPLKEGRDEVDYFEFLEIIDYEVEVASLFKEDELVIPATVSNVTPYKWKQLGARRMHEALANEMSVMAYPCIFGAYIISIRGLAVMGADKGVALLVDGVPCNEYNTGSAAFSVPNWGLGTLNGIEMIKGPGLAIYGSDALHGVISLKTFESDSDHYSVEGTGSYPLYGDANAKISVGFLDNLLRIDTALYADYQNDQNLEYDYSDPEGVTSLLVTVDPSAGTGYRKYRYNSGTGMFKLRMRPLYRLVFKTGVYYSKGSFKDFPGIGEVDLPLPGADEPLHNQDNDVSSLETTFIMTKGLVKYTFANKISMETEGYYWTSKKEMTASAGPARLELLNRIYDDTNRAGTRIIIKQPGNPLKLQWLLAYSYTMMEIEQSYSRTTVEHLVVQDIHELVEGSKRNIHSIFSQLKWGTLNDRLYLILGGRNDHYSDFGYHITPRCALIFLPTRKSSIKAMYGRAFRAPNAVDWDGKESVLKGNHDLKPEIMNAYEFSFVYKDKKLKAVFNSFYNKWENGIIIKDAPELIEYNNKIVNEGKSETIGAELNLFYPYGPINFDLGLSFIKSRALDVTDPGDPSRKTDQEYSAFPEYSIAGGIYYTLKSLDILFYLNNRIYLNMKEAPENAKSDPDALPAYYRMDLNVSRVIAEDAEIYLDIRNILNRKNYMPSLLGVDNGYVEPGISVLLRAEYKI